MMRRRLAVLAALAVGGSILWTVPALADPVSDDDCDVEATTETIDGVTITWDSSFLCTEVGPSGEYSVDVSVDWDNGAEVGLIAVQLSHTTPRPGGCGPDGSAGGLDTPFEAPGDVTLSGESALIETDEGPKANLHIGIEGTVDDEPIRLGVNVLFRGDVAAEDAAGECTPPAPPFADDDWRPGDGAPPHAAVPDFVALMQLPPRFSDLDVDFDFSILEDEGPSFTESWTFPPPWADGTDDEPDAGPPFDTGATADWQPGDTMPPPWADGTDDEPEAGPPFRTGAAVDWQPGDAGPPPWTDGTDDEPDAGPPFGNG